MEDFEDLNLNHKKFSPKTHQFQMSWWVFYFELDFISAEVYEGIIKKGILWFTLPW